jgi:S-ribosylhomocysteine lyase LuxS involved in autoinducer biosynthesis
MACTFRGRLMTQVLNTGWLAVPLSHPNRCGWINAFSLSESKRTNQTISDALCSQWLCCWTVTSCLS